MSGLPSIALAGTGVLQLLKYGLYAILVMLVYMAVNPVKRWRYRHIPGPFGWPLLGNFVSINRDLMGYLSEMKKKHGRIFKIWFGTHPWVIICDPDAARKLASRLNHHNGFGHALTGKERYLMDHLMPFLEPELWRVMKKVWDPAVTQRASLEGYVPLMQECADELVARIGAVPKGEAVDIHVEIAKMTMDIVGSIAFGIKFHDSSSGAEALGLGGDYLRATTRKLLGSFERDKSTAWMAPLYIFPDAAELIRLLANALPDAGHKRMVEAMREMGEAARRLIQLSAAQRQRAEGGVAVGDAGTDADASMVEADGVNKTSRAQRVLPGSFVVQLEAWRSKYEGSVTINDNLLAAQVITFLLAGYETSSHALAYLAYRMSIHPEAQRKLQEELDEVLGGRKPTLEDLVKLRYLDACLKETARLHTAAFGFSRVFHGTSGDPPTLELLGKAIPRKTVVMAPSFSMHVDPQYWERPQEFLPERFLPEAGSSQAASEHPLFQFGYGGRKCTGFKFAEQEMMLVGAALFQRFSFSRPAGEGPLKEAMGITLHPKEGVRVLVWPRS